MVGGRGEDKTIFYLGNGRLFRNGSILSKYFKTSSINLEYKEEEFAIESELGNIESDEVLNHKYIKKLDELFKANSMIYNFMQRVLIALIHIPIFCNEIFFDLAALFFA